MKGALDLIWRAVGSRWLVLAAGLWIESVAGTAYTFGVYSQSLKVALGYDQKRLDKLAFFKTIGGNVGVFSGLFYDVVPPWVVVLAGAVESGFGYSMLWLSVTGRISPPPPFWLMCVFICLASNSNTLFSTASVVTNVKIFPNERGIVIGLLKGFLGLSGAVFAQVFHAIYPDDPSSFLLLISWLPVVVSVLLMGVIRVLPASKSDNAAFKDFSTIATCLAAYLTLVIIVEDFWSDRAWLTWGLCLVLFGFFLSLFVVVIKAEWKDSKMNQGMVTEPLLCDQGNIRGSDSGCSERRPAEIHGTDPEIILSQEEILASRQGEDDLGNRSAAVNAGSTLGPGRGDEHTLSQAVLSLDFWLLVVAMFCSLGSGTTTIDNMGQIGASLGYKQVDINTFISLISIWNFVGRFGAGIGSEFLLHQRGFARPCCLALSLGLMCVGHLVMASAATGSLYVGSIITGVCYGAQWSLMPATTSELFGLQRFGTLYNTISIASPVAAYVLSVQVAGYFYDIEAKRQRNLAALSAWLPNLTNTEDPLLCQGPSCFRITFIILAVVCAFGCAICLWLYFRTKRFYAQVYEKLHKVE